MIESSTSRNREKALQTRRRLQAVARTIFADRGYAKTSIEMIARAAGASIGGIYLRFTSKEDLYVSLLEDPLERIRVEFDQLDRGMGAQLHEYWSVLKSWATQSPEECRILHMLASNNEMRISPLTIDILSKDLSGIRTALENCITDGIGRGVYRSLDAREVASLMWSSFLGDLEAVQTHANLGTVWVVEPINLRYDRTMRMIQEMLTP